MENKKVNKYLMGISHCFKDEETFEIEAENKKDALEKAKIYVQGNYVYSGNYALSSLRCIKKINTKNKIEGK